MEYLSFKKYAMRLSIIISILYYKNKKSKCIIL